MTAARLLFTIGPEHVGKSIVQTEACECCGAPGHTYWLTDSIGRVLPGDVGKRAYRVGGVIQVENDQQRDERLAREGKP